MIVYGYSVERAGSRRFGFGADEDAQEYLDDWYDGAPECLDEPTDVKWITCYSVSYDPEAAMFGIVLSDDYNPMFFPISVSSLQFEATDEQKEMLAKAVAVLPEEYKEIICEKDPDVFIFVNDDD